MTAPHIVDPAGLLGEALSDASPDLMRSLLQTMINALLPADADQVIGAGWGQPTPGRTAQRNSYRHRDLDTRAGTIDVAIPKLRSCDLHSRPAPRAAQTGRGSLGHRRRRRLPRRSQHAADGQAGQDPRHQHAVEVTGLADGRRPRRGCRRVPPPTPRRRRAVHVRRCRRVDQSSVEHSSPTSSPAAWAGSASSPRTPTPDSSRRSRRTCPARPGNAAAPTTPRT